MSIVTAKYISIRVSVNPVSLINNGANIGDR